MSVPWWEAPHPDPDVEPAGQWNGPHPPGWGAAVAGVEKMLARRGRKTRRRRAAAEEPRR